MQQACGVLEVCKLQPSGKLIDPADLPPVDRCVLLVAKLGEPDERRTAVVEVLAGFDQRLGEQPVDRCLDCLPSQSGSYWTQNGRDVTLRRRAVAREDSPCPRPPCFGNGRW